MNRVMSHWLTRQQGGKSFIYRRIQHILIRLYGVGYMIKDHSDSKRGNPLLQLHGLLFSISRKGYFYMHHPTDRIAHTMTFVTPVMEHWLELELAQLVHLEGSTPWPIAPWANVPLESYVLLLNHILNKKIFKDIIGRVSRMFLVVLVINTCIISSYIQNYWDKLQFVVLQTLRWKFYLKYCEKSFSFVEHCDQVHFVEKWLKFLMLLTVLF